MKDYTNYRNFMNIDMELYSGNCIFNEQCKQEGTAFLVNDKAYQMIDDEEVPYFGIIRNAGVKDKNTLEERKLIFEKKYDIKRGDYITYNDDIYIILPKIDEDNKFFNSTKCVGCNQILKWKTSKGIFAYPCYITNDSYGVKLLSDNSFTKSQNAKANIVLQYNEITKQIDNDFRFIFNNNEHDIYEVIDISTSMNVGILTLTCQKSLYLPEDDIENNLAYIKEFGDTETSSGELAEYSIAGDASIIKNTSKVYKISPDIPNVKFELDEWSLECETAIIEDNHDGTCEITGGTVIANTPIELIAKLDNTIIATKEINITIK